MLYSDRLTTEAHSLMPSLERTLYAGRLFTRAVNGKLRGRGFCSFVAIKPTPHDTS